MECPLQFLWYFRDKQTYAVLQTAFYGVRSIAEYIRKPSLRFSLFYVFFVSKDNNVDIYVMVRKRTTLKQNYERQKYHFMNTNYYILIVEYERA